MKNTKKLLYFALTALLLICSLALTINFQLISQPPIHADDILKPPSSINDIPQPPNPVDDTPYPPSSVTDIPNPPSPTHDTSTPDIPYFYSEDGTLRAYVSKVDTSARQLVTVTVENLATSEKNDILLSWEVRECKDILFLDNDTIAVTSHKTPSLNQHGIYTISTGEHLKTHYGLDFTYAENGDLYYIRPLPKSVLDDVGHYKIMDKDGNVLYETGTDVVITGGLKIDSSYIYFTETYMPEGATTYSQPVEKKISINPN